MKKLKSIRIDEELILKIEKEASEESRKFSNVVNLILKKYFEKKQSK